MRPGSDGFTPGIALVAAENVGAERRISAFSFRMKAARPRSKSFHFANSRHESSLGSTKMP